jgi:hypothetical protein
VLGIYLTLRSFAIGSGQICSGITIEYTSSQNSIIIISLVSLGLILMATSIFILSNLKLKNMYSRIYQYEFILVEKE